MLLFSMFRVYIVVPEIKVLGRGMDSLPWNLLVFFFRGIFWSYSAPSVNAIGCTDVQICSSNFILLNSEEIFSVQSFLMSLQRKLLAIYLHHDESVLTNVFCSQMLCAESIVSYLSQNFITWAWDMTKEANRAR